jgi:CBS domain-containing membrane protein
MSTESPSTENGQAAAQESRTEDAPADGVAAGSTEAPAVQSPEAAPKDTAEKDTAEKKNTADENSAEGPKSEPEAVEVDAESIHPPPPVSLRPKTAKDVTSKPLGVTAQLPAPVWPPRTVADLMTRKIITVGEKEPIGNLEAWMEKFQFRHLPVVEAGMKLVGLISRTDLLHAELGRMPDGTSAPRVDGQTLAEAIMNRNVVFAQLDMPIGTACRAMLEKKLTCIPVVLDDHTLVGILTATDFVRLALECLEPKAR